MQAITNPVNCLGVMGAGMAKTFRDRFPVMYEDYRRKCKAKQIKIGEPDLYKDASGKWILNFPTKYHWKNPSELRYIEAGLDYLVNHISVWGITGLAVPALGCGLGGLSWSKVGPIMTKAFSKLNIPIEIYMPQK